MNRATVAQLYALAEAMLTAGTERPEVRRLLEQLEAGELGVDETTARLRELHSADGRRDHPGPH